MLQRICVPLYCWCFRLFLVETRRTQIVLTCLALLLLIWHAHHLIEWDVVASAANYDASFVLCVLVCPDLIDSITTMVKCPLASDGNRAVSAKLRYEAG